MPPAAKNSFAQIEQAVQRLWVGSAAQAKQLLARLNFLEKLCAAAVDDQQTEIQQISSPVIPTTTFADSFTFFGLAAGKDVRYAVVWCKTSVADFEKLHGSSQATLTYPPEVAGTELVYDITGEFLQGKARPFEIDLKIFPLRVFVLLPFQLEGIKAEQVTHAATAKTTVEFLDGRGETICGALPFFLLPAHTVEETSPPIFLATSPAGHFSAVLSAAPQISGIPQPWRIHSQLDGSQTVVQKR